MDLGYQATGFVISVDIILLMDLLGTSSYLVNKRYPSYTYISLNLEIYCSSLVRRSCLPSL